ncbi:hypothetical protein VTI74DRAFT_1959 [Chaetomium olivicolor]
MKPYTLLLALSSLNTATANAIPAPNQPSTRATWPNGPFTTSGRYILDGSGHNITYAGVNWPGHADVMIPEGLQYQSVESIVDKIKSLGMNAVRLTFAIQMVDELYSNGGKDVTIQKAFVQALGEKNGTAVLKRMLERNPRFTAKTNRLDVWDAVVAELGRREVGLAYMANHGTALTPGTRRFRREDFAGYGQGKLVLELHNYGNDVKSCDSLKQNLERNGFEAMRGGKEVVNVFPVVMTEFGFQMDESTWRGVYASCSAGYLPSIKAGWMIWVLAGSYYVRSGVQDYEEGWGLLTHDWSAWRSQGFVDGASRGMVRETSR